jgi:hypothetical protein
MLWNWILKFFVSYCIYTVQLIMTISMPAKTKQILEIIEKYDAKNINNYTIKFCLMDFR